MKNAGAILAQILQGHFPGLSTFADTQTSHIQQVEALTRLAVQLALCEDERAACKILQALCPS